MIKDFLIVVVDYWFFGKKFCSCLGFIYIDVDNGSDLNLFKTRFILAACDFAIPPHPIIPIRIFSIFITVIAFFNITL